jgi:hypothetical protein
MEVMARGPASLTTEIVKETYESLTGTASSIIRQLSLAGIALIWIFRSGSSSAPVLERPLLLAASLIFAALTLDLLQYLIGAVTWHLYFLCKERQSTSPETVFEAPKWINWPTWTLFWFKAAFMIAAYAYILYFLAGKFFK